MQSKTLSCTGAAQFLSQFFLVSALASAVTLSAGIEQESQIVPDTDSVARTVEGPWGTLQYYHFYLEAPKLLLSYLDPHSVQTRWAVPVEANRELNDALIQAGLTPVQMDRLTDPGLRIVADGLYCLFPDVDTLLALSQEGRTSLYSFLSRYPCNQYVQSPVQFFSGDVQRWASESSIRPELVQLISDLTYYRGNVLVFADIPFVLSQCRSESEVMALSKDFTRVRTIVVRLEVNERSDADALLDYWSTGLALRRKDIEPLIRSAIRTKDVGLIDLLHLLPPLPRKLLYTYPDVSMAAGGQLPDCHWTTLNFFNYNPQLIYHDERLAASAIMERFDPVPAPYQYGDVLMFMTDDGYAHHSCTYLAADIVFTKNGFNILMPWILANLGDVANLYQDYQGKPLSIKGYRRRPD